VSYLKNNDIKVEGIVKSTLHLYPNKLEIAETTSLFNTALKVNWGYGGNFDVSLELDAFGLEEKFWSFIKHRFRFKKIFENLLIVSLIFFPSNNSHGETCSGQSPKHNLGCVMVCYEGRWYENCGSDDQTGTVARDVCGAKPPIKDKCDYTCLNGAWVQNFCP